MLSNKRRLHKAIPTAPRIWSSDKPYPAEADMAQFDASLISQFTLWDATTDALASLTDVDNGNTGIDEHQYDYAHPANSNDALRATNGGAPVSLLIKKASSGMDRRYSLEQTYCRNPVTGDVYGMCAVNRSVKTENDAREYVVYRRAASRAELSSATTQVFASNPGGGYNYSGGVWFIEGTTQYAILPSFRGTSSDVGGVGHFANLKGVLLRLENPGPSEVVTVIGQICDLWPLGYVLTLDNGNRILAGGNKNARPCVAISHGSDITSTWDTVEIPCPAWWPIPAYNEIAITAKGSIIRAYIRPPNSGPIYRSISRDCGRTWTMAAPDLMPVQNKKPGAHVLSNGITALATTYGGLDTLALNLTRPGSDNFDMTLSLLPGDPPLVQYPYDPDTGEIYGYSQTYTRNPLTLQGDGSYKRTGSKVTARHGRGRTYVYLTEENGKLIGTYTESHEKGKGFEIAISALDIYRAPSANPIASWKLDEVSGVSILADESGNGNTLATTGSPAIERFEGPHVGSYSRYFNGSTNLAYCEIPAQVGPLSGMSFGTWVWFGAPMSGTNSPVANQHVAGVYQSGSSCWFIGTSYSGGVNRLTIFANQFSTGSTIFSAQMEVPTPFGWYYIMIVDDKAGLRIEINGTEIDIIPTVLRADSRWGFPFRAGCDSLRH